MLSPDEKLIPICYFDDQEEIRFTKEFMALTEELGAGRRMFVSHLITHWQGDHLQNLLNYFGPEDDEQDKYSGIDGEPMNVREDTTDLWEYYGKPYDGLEGEWYRDILRAKLITIKLPERLIKDYVKVAKKASSH